MPDEICPPTSEVSSATSESTQEESPEETSSEEEPEKLVQVESQNASTDAGAVLNVEVPEALPEVPEVSPEVPEVLPDTEKTAICTVPDSEGNSSLLTNNNDIVNVELALEIAEKLIHTPGPVVMDTPPLTPEGDAEASSKETAPIPSIAQTISEFFV